MPAISRNLLISASLSNYVIFFESSITTFSYPDNSIVLADERFRDLLESHEAPKIFLSVSEEIKSLETCTQILAQLQDLGANRSTTLIAVGGGIIQDIATLVCSLYMRGIDWIFFPTTAMAQLDSCVGGKSSINLKGKKNIVGNIFPPKEIHIDSSFSFTLSNASLASGFLEGVKISFAHSEDGFTQNLETALQYRDFGLIPIMELNKLVLTQKKYFIETDEFDRGIRQNLNFGHTFGHALESASHYSMQHGLAIGLGMIMAIHHPSTFMSKKVQALEAVIINILRMAGKESISSVFKIDNEIFVDAFMSDKKHTHGNYTIILPSEDGLKKSSQPWDDESCYLMTSLLTNLKVKMSHEI